jgi:hypothetical protein
MAKDKLPSGKDKPGFIKKIERNIANDKKHGRDNPKNPSNKPNGK